MFHQSKSRPRQEPWNKGKLIGQKSPFTMQEIWSIRMRLQTIGNVRDLALFNLAIDSKLRACDLLYLRVSDVASGGEVRFERLFANGRLNDLCDSRSPREQENQSNG